MAIYLDNSATTRPFDEVIDLTNQIMRDEYGNASSLHRMGMEAEEHLKTARKQVADALGASPEEIIFTSGGTESDNMALLCGAEAKKRQGNRIVSTVVEHPAVLESLKKLEEADFEVVRVPVTGEGIVDMEAMKEAINEDTILISCMHVNNETGAIMPIEEIGKMKGDALFHVDLVQSFGKLDIPLHYVDLASISAHKIHGPKGIGAIYIKKGLHLEPFVVGGGQEGHMRSGTENVPSIAGLGLAAEIIYQDREAKNARLKGMKERMWDIFEGELDDVLRNSPENGAPHILNVTFEGTRGEVLLHMLEEEGIFVSTGSACASNHHGRSHVILAQGRTDEQVDATLRFSLCDQNTMEEIEEAAQKTVACVKRFRTLGKFQ